MSHLHTPLITPEFVVLCLFNFFGFLIKLIFCSLEVDSDVEVFEMKHEINSLQAKLDEGRKKEALAVF